MPYPKFQRNRNERTRRGEISEEAWALGSRLQSVPVEMKSLVLSNLSLGELAALCQLDDWDRLARTSLLSRVREHLATWGLPPDKTLTAMGLTGTVISGSLALLVTIPSWYDAGDIDFYCPLDGATEFGRFLEGVGYRRKSKVAEEETNGTGDAGAVGVNTGAGHAGEAGVVVQGVNGDVAQHQSAGSDNVDGNSAHDEGDEGQVDDSPGDVEDEESASDDDDEYSASDDEGEQSGGDEDEEEEVDTDDDDEWDSGAEYTASGIESVSTYVNADGSRSINVIQSKCDTAWLPILFFHSTVVMNAITSKGVVILYPTLTLATEGLANVGTALSKRRKAKCHKAIAKYEDRGFVINAHCDYLEGPKVHGYGGHEYNCQYVYRSLDDGEVLKVGFREWDDVEIEGPKLKWRLGGGFCWKNWAQDGKAPRREVEVHMTEGNRRTTWTNGDMVTHSVV